MTCYSVSRGEGAEVRRLNALSSTVLSSTVRKPTVLNSTVFLALILFLVALVAAGCSSTTTSSLSTTTTATKSTLVETSPVQGSSTTAADASTPAEATTAGLPRIPEARASVVVAVGDIKTSGSDPWTRAFRAEDGTIYFQNHLKSVDGGLTVTAQNDIDVESITSEPERAVLVGPGLFYATGGPATYVSPGEYRIPVRRSTDGLKTFTEESATVYVPGGPTRDPQDGEFYGLYVYRTIVVLPSGSWLMTMEGNLAEDTLVPSDADAQREVTYLVRSLVVESVDQGRTWHYLSSIAVPQAGDPVGEGFGEPALTLLDDGRLLCVMRSGHHFPLYASWSSDEGKTWTLPLYTGLDRGCDPCLLTLQDGRVALSWGRRYPEGWSVVTPEGDQDRFAYPGEGYTNLAISTDGGATWTNQEIAQGTGSCYSTIFEVAPDVLFFQVDGWYWRVTLVAEEESG